MTTPAPLEPRASLDLFDHDRALVLLARAWRSGRLAHAWLLTGRQGIGKATLAFRFARALLAGPAAVGERLALAPEHPVFRQVAQGAHPDLHVIEAPRDPRTGRLKSEIPVDAVRRATAALHSTAAMGGRRVLIVDGAEQLNRNAANALLKPLEEPPAGAVLLLVAHQPARLPATLRSRCSKLRLESMPEVTVATILEAQAPRLAAEERAALARLARGSAGRALALAALDSLPLYRRLAAALGDEPVDRLALHTLAAELARQGESHGLGAPLELVQELLGRALGVATGAGEPPLYPGEAEALARLAGRQTLDRWPRLWEKIARLSARAEGLNLDRFQVFLHILGVLAPAGHGDEDAPGGRLPGGHHAIG